MSHGSALAFVLIAAAAQAQTPYLVRDINTVPDPLAATDPRDLTAASDALYFMGAGDANGSEPRRLQGSGPVTLIQDFSPGPNPYASSSPPVAMGNRLFFIAGPGPTTEPALWVTDGTPGGTTLLRAFGAGFRWPREMTVAGGYVFFFVDTGTGYELWKSDGTSGGTVSVAPVDGTNLIGAGSRAFFVRSEPLTGRELWTSDGTLAGTQMVQDVCPGPCDGIVGGAEQVAIGDVLFFRGDDGAIAGSELWRSDGTATGTVLVKDIVPGAAASHPTGLCAFGNLLLFGAGDGLWRSDGTGAGTMLVRDGVSVSRLHDAGGTAFFVGSEPTTGSELWKTDGSTAGTARLTDACPGPCSFLIVDPRFSSVPGRVMFTVSSLDDQLWRSDGTAAGTQPVRSFVKLGDRFARHDGEAYFPADDGVNGLELWKTDGTASGTVMVTNLIGSTSKGYSLRAVADRYYFTAFRPDLGVELWSSAGTAASTTFIDLTPGPSSPNLGFSGSLDTHLLFGAYGSEAAGVWRTDGSPGGTVRLTTTEALSNFAESGGRALFAGGLSPGAGEPWSTDGTAAGTFRLADLYPGSLGSEPSDFVRFGEDFVFLAGGLATRGVFRTDGTREGTSQILERSCSQVFPVNHRLFLECYDLATGSELWLSDGTADGTRLLKDINPGPLDSSIRQLTDVEGVLYFNAVGRLWRSDGTEAGTQPLSVLTSLPDALEASELTVSNGVLYFVGSTLESGRELWRTDGTPAGTFMVADLQPGPLSSVVGLASAGSGVLVSAYTPANGVEVWTSDGTPGGLTALPEIVPGPGSSYPNDLVRADGHVFFYAYAPDEATGYELWAVAEPPGTLAIRDVTLREGDGGTANAVFEVRMASPSTAPVTLAYTTVAGTAQAGSDFIPQSGVLTFLPGTDTLTVQVPVTGDLQDEPDEAFSVVLSSITGGVLADSRGVALILDDDVPRVAISGASVVEGDLGTTDAVFEVTLTTKDGTGTPEAKAVGFETASLTAAQGLDFDAVSGTLTFPAATPSGTTLTVRVPARGDTADEPDETFQVSLRGRSDAALPPAPAIGLIVDDDGVDAMRPVELAHGSVVRATLAPPPGRVADRDFYVLRQQPRASYELLVDEVSGDAVPLQVTRVQADGSTVLQTAQTIGTGGSLSLRWQNTTPAPISEQHVRIESPTCGTSCGDDDSYRVRFYETTLSASRFNNTVGQVTVVTLQNVSSQAVSGRVFFWSTAGYLWTTHSFQLGPFGNATVNSAPLIPSSGSVTVSHDGPYGSLVGKVVALEPSTGFSFDTPMTYRPR